MKYELYEYETYGVGTISPNNGYSLGKSWMDVQISMWNEDLQKGYLFISELYDDPNYPHWWLDKVLKKF